MKQIGLYVIFDRVAEQSGQIFEAVNDGTALRHFKQAVAKADPSIVEATEFALLYVGAVDHETNQIFLSGTEPREVITTVESEEGNE